MPKFTVKQKVASWVEYTYTVEAEDEAEALEEFDTSYSEVIGEEILGPDSFGLGGLAHLEDQVTVTPEKN